MFLPSVLDAVYFFLPPPPPPAAFAFAFLAATAGRLPVLAPFAAAWEGSRSRPGGKRQKIAFGGYDAAIERGKDGKKGAGGRGGGGPAAKGARTGKRPAVAARKAKAKAAAGGGGGGKKK